MFFDDHFFEGGDVDLTMFPPACLAFQKRAKTSPDRHQSMVQLLSNFFDIFVLTGWGQRDWWVTEESDEEWKNDDKLHEVEVKLLLYLEKNTTRVHPGVVQNIASFIHISG